MGKLVYITNVSLDGYVEDATGAFDWANPAGVFEFITELIRPMEAYLYGRRVYETMAYWGAPALEEYLPEQRDFARLWQRAEKIVFSQTLTAAATHNTRIERDFNPDVVRKLKRDAKHDLDIGGAQLAGVAFEAGLIDECHLFVHPAIVGGGKPAFPAARRSLELLETHRFDTGVVHLHYRIPTP
jgi:dihydrofolate reductase